MREHQATGLEHLALVTELLQSARLASPRGGVWETADFQWAWRHDQHPDPSASTFWLDDVGRPVSAIVFTDFGDTLACELLDARHDSSRALAVVGARLEELIGEHGGAPIETTIRADDAVMLEAVDALGFVADGHREVMTAMAAADRPPVTPFPDDFALMSRAARSDRPHPMISRNGEDLEARLRECSLYRPELDLCVVERTTDAVAAYSLFWADPVTGVGLVEPMRTEDAFQRRGLASALLRAGLDRLARSGCSELRILFAAGNEPARRAYLGAGFRPVVECRRFVRAPR